jgi:hypothetical protein
MAAAHGPDTVHTLDVGEVQSLAADIALGAHDIPKSVGVQLERLLTALDASQSVVQRRNQSQRDLIADMEHRYVEAINAVLAADGHRPWVDAENRGKAMAHRVDAERLRRDAGLAVPDYGGADWRASHGVIPDLTLALRRREHLESCTTCPAA